MKTIINGKQVEVFFTVNTGKTKLTENDAMTLASNKASKKDAKVYRTVIVNNRVIKQLNHTVKSNG